MTVSSNIHFGLSAWTASHAYTVGNRVSNAGNAYACIAAGTSAASGGPTTTAASITDGSVTWKFLSTIDYTSVQAWFNAIPSTITQAYVGMVWNDGTITTTTGTSFLSASTRTGSSATNTITLTAAPGESFRDKAGGVALGINTANGASFTFPSGTGFINYFDISCDYFIFDGLQIYDPNTTSICTLIGVESTALHTTIQNCILSGTAQSSGAVIVGGPSPVTILNTIIIDNQASTDNFGAVSGNPVTFINSVLYGANNPTNGIGINSPGTIKNSAIFGYGNNACSWSTGSVSVDHSLFDASSANTTMAIGTGVLFGKTAANQFVSPGTDFRLKAGADCLNAGTTDTTDIPAGNDAVWSTRLLGTTWDIGPFEYVPPSAPTALAIGGQGAAYLSRSVTGNSVWYQRTASGVAGQSDLASGSANWFARTVAGSGFLTEPASGSPVAVAFSATGTAAQAGQTTGNATALNFTAAGALGQSNLASSFITVPLITAMGTMQAPIGAAGSANFYRLTALGIGQQTSASGRATAINFTALGAGQINNTLAGSPPWLRTSAAGSASLAPNTAVISYIHFNLTAWAQNTLYSVGNRVSNGGNAYICTGAGRSQNLTGAGPIGTGGGITDGTAVWQYLSRIDYTTLQAWANALPIPTNIPGNNQPTSLTNPVIAYVSGTFNTGAATSPVLNLTGHNTTTTNTITIAALLGQSFRDQAAGMPLAFNSNAGTSIILGTAQNPWNWLEIGDNNVTIRGLQVQQTPTDGCTLFQVDSGASNVLIDSCIFDGAGQTGGADMLVLGGNGITLANSLIVDRQPSSGGGYTINAQQTARIVNCTEVATSSPAAAVGVRSASTTPGAVIVRNCIMAGFGNGLFSEGTPNVIAADHNAFTASVYGTNVNNAGGNLLSVAPGFINSATDFRLAPNSVCIDAGVADTLDIPSSDIFYSYRPSGNGWDIGASEAVQTHAVNFLLFRPTGSANPGVNAQGAATPLVFTAQGAATSPQPGTGAATWMTVSASGALAQNNAQSGFGTFLFLTVNGFGQIPVTASGSGVWLTQAAQGSARQDAIAAGTATFFNLLGAGNGNTPVPASGTIQALSFTANGNARADQLATGRATALTFGATGTAAPSRTAQGSALAIDYHASGAIAFANAFLGSAGFYTPIAVGSALQENTARANLDTIQFLAGGQARQAQPVSGNANAFRFGAAGSAANPFPMVGNAQALQFTALGRVTLSTNAQGTATPLVFGASGQAVFTQFASGAARYFGFSASGSTAASITASGQATPITFAGTGALGQTIRAYAIATPFTFTASGALAKMTLIQGQATALRFGAAGSMAQTVFALGTTTFLAPTAQGQLTIYAAQGAATFLNWSATGNALREQDAAGQATWLGVTGQGNMSSAVGASGAATFLTLTSRGVTYQIPAGGRVDETVYFSRDDRLIFFRT